MSSHVIDNDIHREEIHYLAGQVHRRLNGRVRHFRLLVRGEGLVLQGQAHTFYVKQLAQHTIMEATRFPILANNIEVTTSAG